MPRVGVLAIVAAIVVVTVGGLVVARTLITTGPLSPARPVALDAPHFVDEASGAGIDHTYGGDYPYVVGGGVATFDCDDDGAPDLYLAGGADPAALYRNEARSAGPCVSSRLQRH